MEIIRILVNVVIIGLWGLASVSIFIVSFRDAWNEVGKECFGDLKSGIVAWKSKISECIEIIRK